MPKLSIITVNLNNAEGLQKTIKSVVSQIFTDYEYIIIDGGSTDGSVDVIKKYADKITYWVSEPDKGIYNAMNKGIRVAKGEYCQFLNSGDYLVDENVLANVFSLGFNEDIVYGDILVNGNILKSRYILNLFFFINETIPHPASFIKKELFKKHGLYNEDLIIASDWEFFLKTIIFRKCSYKYIAMKIVSFDLNGISNQEYNKTLIKEERTEILRKNIDFIVQDYSRISTKLERYENSRLFQLIRKFQNSKLFKKLYIFKI